jgi:hypothetical protein
LWLFSVHTYFFCVLSINNCLFEMWINFLCFQLFDKYSKVENNESSGLLWANWRDIVMARKRPRRMLVQANTIIKGTLNIWLLSPSEYPTSLVFRWLICVLKSNGQVFKWSISLAYLLWSENRSGFWMVKKKMANFTIQKPDTNCVQFSDGDCT